MIRLATEADVPRIAEIDVSSCRYAYKDIVSDEILFKYTLVHNRMADFGRWITDKSFSIYVYEDDSNTIIKGMMGIGSCHDPDKPQAFELHFMYIEPCYSRQGLGSSMIDFFEHTGIQLGYREFVVWVLNENRIGIDCYTKNNYLCDGSTKTFKRFNKTEIRYTKTIP